MCMPLTLPPPINLSAAREFVKFEITCTGRPAPPRPALPSYDSFASASTSSTDGSASARKSRPSLSPEALLIHAFGPSALSSLIPPASVGSAPSEQQADSSQPSTVSSTVSTRSSASFSCASPKKKRQERHDVHPAPPPRGTFRSVPRPTRTSPPLEGKLPLTELMPFRSPRDESPAEIKRHAPPCECERVPERELPTSPELWREKIEERLQRRKVLRPKFRGANPAKPSKDVGCRPLECSIAITSRPEAPRPEKPSLRQRNHSSPSLSNDGEKRTWVHDRGETRSGGDAPPRRNSMVEMQDIGDLIKQCDSMNLEDSPK